MMEAKQGDTKLEIIPCPELEAALCRKSLYFFFQAFIGEVIKEDIVLNWHIKFLCEYMQELVLNTANGQPTKADFDIVCIPPGTTKSSIISVILPAWIWIVAPHFRLITASHTLSLAREFADKSKQIINSDKFRQMFDVRIRADKSAKTNYGNQYGGSRLSVGTGTAITGYHAHFIIVDDPETNNKIHSAPYREMADKYTTGVLPSRKVDKKTVPLVLVMQRLHNDDCVGFILKNKPNARKNLTILPAEISEKIRPVPEKLAEKYQDGFLDSNRLGKDVLLTQQDTFTPTDYNAQFLQLTTNDETSLIRRGWFDIVDAYERTKINFVADTAYTDKTTNDPSAIAAYCVQSNGDVVILDVLYGHWEFPQLIAAFSTFINRHNPNGIVEIEPKASGKSAVQSLKMQLPNVKESEIPVDSKLSRLSAASPTVFARRFKLLRGSWNEHFITEISTFPLAKNDESVDLLTMINQNVFIKKKGMLLL